MFQTDLPISLANADKNPAFGPWRILYRPKLRRHSWRNCFVYICFSESRSNLIWYIGLRPKFSVTSRFALIIRPETKWPNGWDSYTIRYGTRCYFNVRWKAWNMSRLSSARRRQLKIVKTEKLKSKNRYVTSNSKSLGNHVVSPEEEKKAAVGRICRKRRF